MRIIKLKKSDYKSLVSLYRRIGCVHEDRQAFPHHTFVSPRTYKQIEKATTAEYKKEYPHLNKKSVTSSVAMYLLNLGPCTLAGLPDNVILVDTNSVDEEIECYIEGTKYEENAQHETDS
jgi:hypothetical protein